MHTVKRFDKLLKMKEFQKNEANTAYQEARFHFEQQAENLYRLLKKKEELLAQEEQQMQQQNCTIAQILANHQFVEVLEKEIAVIQQHVIAARQMMQTKQQHLVIATVETKKYDKIYEKKKEIHKKEVATQEQLLLNEMSIQMYSTNRK
ncbi:MAG: flagellar export protein FliJ [Bacilli bacterium]